MKGLYSIKCIIQLCTVLRLPFTSGFYVQKLIEGGSRTLDTLFPKDLEIFMRRQDEKMDNSFALLRASIF